MEKRSSENVEKLFIDNHKSDLKPWEILLKQCIFGKNVGSQLCLKNELHYSSMITHYLLIYHSIFWKHLLQSAPQ